MAAPERDCERCGAAFVPGPYQHRRKFCSLSCARVAENERKRRWDDENRAPCISCGEPTGHPTERGNGRCEACHTERETARREVTISLMSDLWCDGHDRNEIAELLGWTPNSVHAIISKTRRTRPELFPYRSPAWAAYAARKRDQMKGRRIGSDVS